MSFDLILRQARIAGREGELVDIAVAEGKIAAIEKAVAIGGPEERLDGRLVVPGLVDTHIHLDKSCILDRCSIVAGTLQEAIAQAAAAKHAFTEEDIYARARRTLEKAILAGTMRMRTHVEIDPRIGLKGLRAIGRLARDYAWAVDLEICVFPQEGLINDPGTEELLVKACSQGAALIGGCPYTDTQPDEHIARIFEIALRFDLDIDFHLDFDLDTSWMHLDEVCRHAIAAGYGGRVTVGHVTKLSALPRATVLEAAQRLAAAGIAVTVLPATDLFLMGRGQEANIPRGLAPAMLLREHGVVCSIATNNVLNPFTPFGDCSLIRMANLYANVGQLGRPRQIAACLDMVTGDAARLMNLKDYGITVGNPADLLVLDCESSFSAVAELARPLAGFKAGRKSFEATRPRLCPPHGA